MSIGGNAVHCGDLLCAITAHPIEGETLLPGRYYLLVEYL